MSSRVALLGALCALVIMVAGASTAGAATPTELFFSEYIEGSSNNKALEIYNGTGAAVNLNTGGYNVQMFFNGSSAAGLTINLNGTVADGDVFVLAQASAGAAIQAQADQTNGAGWFNGDDAVVLRKGTTVLDVIGEIGFDPGTEWGTGLTSTADNTLRRKPTIAAGDAAGNNPFDPSIEWDGFANDTFDGLGSHVFGDTVNLSVSDVSLNEGHSGTTSFTFTVGLTAPAGAGGVTFDIATADGTATAPSDYTAQSLTGQTIPPGSSSYAFTVLVNGDTDVEPDETFFVNVSNVTGATVTDGQGIGTIRNEDLVCGDPATFVHDVQGGGATSPLTGQVVEIEGVVVGDFQGTGQLGGFHVQEEDADADADPSTSEGIFVFNTSFPVEEGDLVRVRGTVTEFNGLTELTGVNAVSVCSTGATVTQTNVSLPTDLERYEGMLVRLPQSLVISEYFNYDRFGELVLALPLEGESRPFTPTSIDEPGGPALARLLANQLRRITLDDGLNVQNPSVVRHPNGDPFSLANRFRGGDTVQNAVGVLDFSFSLYRIQPTGPADYTAVNARPAAPEPVGGSVQVAAMNTLNFFLTPDYPSGNPLDNRCGPLQNVECRGADFDQPDEFTRQRDKLLAALAGLDADVIGLNELENTTGVDPLADPAGLVPGLNAMLGAGTYASIDTGTIGTDAIKVGLIYKPAKVMPVGAYRILDSSVDPRFIDTKSRPVLAQTFEELATGARFTVAVNHLKSKGSDCNDVGDPDTGDGQGNCNLTRKAAAEALVDWLATDPTGSGDPDFLIMGDLNSYAQEDPIDAIKAGSDGSPGTGDDYTNLVQQFVGTFAYSFVFDGMAGYLDHALSTQGLTSQVTGVTEWHINADEPDILDYDTSFKPPAQDALYEPNAFRSSDHDPVLVGLSLSITFDDLCRLVERVVTKPGVAAALCDKLAAAEAADAGGNAKERNNILNAFRNQVDAQTGKSISAADAAQLKALSLELQ